MTTIIMALLAGVLTTKQAAELKFECMQTAKDDTLVFQCTLFAEGNVVRVLTSNPMKFPTITTKDLAMSWCIGAVESMEFEQKVVEK